MRSNPVWNITLREVAPADDTSFQYVYDLGDNWTHEVLTEGIATLHTPLRHPACIAGARRCPPEDCGAAPGYAGLLNVLRDPDHPKHNEVVRWAGRRFDPEAFDVAAVNRKLRLLK